MKRVGAAPASDRRWFLLLALAALGGTWLRTTQLRSQMLMDDEWHAVRMLLRADYAGIAGHFGLADYSIPLTLYDRWLYRHAALSEWMMHLPLLVAGVALLLVAPLLTRRLPASTRALWCGLLALSPTLIHFSRSARPYALLALLGVLALLAFRRWQASAYRERRWAVTYLLAMALAGWAHLLSLSFTLWPFVHYGWRAVRSLRVPAHRAEGARALRALVGLATLSAALLLALLLPPLLGDWAAMAAKAGVGSIGGGDLWRALRLALGFACDWPIAIGLLLFALGLRRLWRRDRDLVELSLGATGLGCLLILLARPAWIEHAPVLVRYAAPVLPFLLLYPAEGAASLLEKLPARAGAGPLAGALLLAAVIAVGPLRDWYHRPNQFMNHAAFQFDYERSANPYWSLLDLGPVSPFYRRLAELPAGRVTLIEAPARAHSNYSPDPWLQRIHRQKIKYALIGSVCGAGDWDEYPQVEPAPRFRQLLPLDRVLQVGNRAGDYLLLRLQPWTLPRENFPWPVPWPDMAACVERIATHLGRPVWRDEQIVVFALPAADP